MTLKSFPKKSFIRSGEGSIASYDYTDVAEGTGIVKFYGLKTDGSVYKLSTQTLYSVDIDQEWAGGAAGAATKKLDLDFDLTVFNSPRTIKGTGIIQSCYFVTRTSGDGGIEVYVTFKVRKWDGATETEIANVTTTSVQVGTNATAIYLSTAPITIPQTSFAAGDILRLTAEVYFANVAGTNEGYGGIAHDPQNRDGVRINPSTDDPETSTQLNFYCPFKLDL